MYVPATQSEGPRRQVPRLRKVKVHVAKCHACHAKVSVDVELCEDKLCVCVCGQVLCEQVV